MTTLYVALHFEQNLIGWGWYVPSRDQENSGIANTTDGATAICAALQDALNYMDVHHVVIPHNQAAGVEQKLYQDPVYALITKPTISTAEDQSILAKPSSLARREAGIEVSDEVARISSSSNPNLVYRILRTPEGNLACTCPGFRRWGKCKHVKRHAAYLELSGEG